MKLVRLASRIALVLVPGVAASAGASDPFVVAVASNFVRPAEALAARFGERSGQAPRISPGSTGKLYAQITNGAPYAVLLAADVERPELLEQSPFGVAGTRFTYATGGLVLWSADPELAGTDCRAQLDDLDGRHLAIANPLTAPYGAAAMSFLERARLRDKVAANLVYGENVAQVMHFVVSGNASLGLVARAQLSDDRLAETACRWDVPQDAHDPVEQQAILLRAGADLAAAGAFLDFLRSEEGRAIIRSFGYTVPD